MATGVQPITEEAPGSSWKDVLEEILPPQGEWSEEEYLVLTDHRVRLVEFTDGKVEALPTPTREHQMILGFLFLVFCSFFEPRGGRVLFSPLRVRIRVGKYREPDLILLTSAEDDRNQSRFWEGADLVVEVVSKDKPERDLVDKRLDYAEGNVPEYWMVNPLTETISVLQLGGQAYEDTGVYRRGESARSVLNPDFSISVDAVFDAAKKK
jgi:Uma2 family endonuclease